MTSWCDGDVNPSTNDEDNNRAAEIRTKFCERRKQGMDSFCGRPMIQQRLAFVSRALGLSNGASSCVLMCSVSSCLSICVRPSANHQRSQRHFEKRIRERRRGISQYQIRRTINELTYNQCVSDDLTGRVSQECNLNCQIFYFVDSSFQMTVWFERGYESSI